MPIPLSETSMLILACLSFIDNKLISKQIVPFFVNFTALERRLSNILFNLIRSLI